MGSEDYLNHKVGTRIAELESKKSQLNARIAKLSADLENGANDEVILLEIKPQLGDARRELQVINQELADLQLPKLIDYRNVVRQFVEAGMVGPENLQQVDNMIAKVRGLISGALLGEVAPALVSTTESSYRIELESRQMRKIAGGANRILMEEWRANPGHLFMNDDLKPFMEDNGSIPVAMTRFRKEVLPRFGLKAIITNAGGGQNGSIEFVIDMNKAGAKEMHQAVSEYLPTLPPMKKRKTEEISEESPEANMLESQNQKQYITVEDLDEEDKGELTWDIKPPKSSRRRIADGLTSILAGKFKRRQEQLGAFANGVVITTQEREELGLPHYSPT